MKLLPTSTEMVLLAVEWAETWGAITGLTSIFWLSVTDSFSLENYLVFYIFLYKGTKNSYLSAMQ